MNPVAFATTTAPQPGGTDPAGFEQGSLVRRGATRSVPAQVDPATAAITTRGLRRSFASGVALEGLDLDVGRGEVLALLGPNGAGKTTTVRLLNGVLRPDAGTARVLGFDPATQGDELRHHTGVLTETAGLDDRLTARENLVFAVRLRKLGAPAIRRVDELLERFAMAHQANTVVQGFSTGQRRRLALIRALVHEPQLLFLDEPTSGLDPAATRSVVELIGTLASEQGCTVVLCTHFLGEAGRLADRMAVLDHGRLHAIGRPHDLAAALWPGLAVRLDLGRPADQAVLETLRRHRGVIAADLDPSGAFVRVGDRDIVPQLVRTLVADGHDVFGAAIEPVTLEQVYFAIEARIAHRRANTSDHDVFGAAASTDTGGNP
jgi:ABC-2 type transport system ATP-binding protein